MIIWLDAQLSPILAPWITETFSIQTTAARDLDLRHAEDEVIFMAAKEAAAIVMTKDSDFIRLLDQYGTPPQVIWLTCGNTSNAYLKKLLEVTFPQTLTLLKAGEKLVEISDPW